VLHRIRGQHTYRTIEGNEEKEGQRQKREHRRGREEERREGCGVGREE